MITVGTSGWSYDHWTDVLYPPGLPATRRLEAYAAEFGTVELNASFYHRPREAAFAGWRRRLPEGFLMSVKAPRGLTHARRLYAAGAVDRADRRVLARAWRPPRRPALPTATGRTRDDARLERHGAAWCVVSGAHVGCELRATAPFVYVRLHGPDHDHLYAGSYSDADLRWWADRIAEWADQGRDVYAYFNNDGSGNAVRNARTLRWMLDS